MCSPPVCSNMKKKIIRWCFSRISDKKKKKSKHLLSRTLFVDCFRYIERITEGKLKCLLHTALISNAFFDENKDKRKRYSLALKEQNGRFSIY